MNKHDHNRVARITKGLETKSRNKQLKMLGLTGLDKTKGRHGYYLKIIQKPSKQIESAWFL